MVCAVQDEIVVFDDGFCVVGREMAPVRDVRGQGVESIVLSASNKCAWIR